MTIYSIYDKIDKVKASCRFPIKPYQILNFGDIIVRRNSKFMIVIKDMKESDQVMVVERYGSPYIRERKNIWYSTSVNNLMYEF